MYIERIILPLLKKRKKKKEERERERERERENHTSYMEMHT